MTATIAGVATALPSNLFTQERAKRLLERWYLKAPDSGAPIPLATARRAYDNAGVETRYSSIPIEELMEDPALRKKNQTYMETARRLSEEVVVRLFERSPLRIEDVDLIITTSCTGFMIPAVDAYLINRFGFRSDIKRLPVTELGCAAGVASLRMAHDHIRAFPDSTVLLLAVELTTLTFQPTDFDGAHVISTAIFGDGAAGALVTGKPVSGLRIESTGSHFFRNTLDFMGFDLRETGFHIFLSPRIPAFIREELVPTVKSLLSSVPSLGAIRWLVHPGGAKILNAMEEALGIPHGGLEESRGVLRRVGNLSSATIYFVLEKYWSNRASAPFGETAGILAVGPGFSMDFAVCRWKGI
ncbi:MAG: type III polyketide synthase [Candidatus Hydrogenedentota bacterium]